MTCTPRHCDSPRPRSSRRRQSAYHLTTLAVFIAALLAAPPLVVGQAPGPPPPVGADSATTPALRDAVATATMSEPPAVLRWSNREIAVFRATLLQRTPAIRAAGAARTLEQLPVSPAPVVSLRSLAGGVIVSAGGLDVFALIPADLDPADDTTVGQEASRVSARLQLALAEAAELHAPWQMLRAGTLALLATVALVLLLRQLRRGHVALTRRATLAADRGLQRMRGGTVVRESRLLDQLPRLLSAVSIAVTLALIYAWATFVLRRFPYTRPWGEPLRELLIDRLLAFGQGMLDAVPDLFTVLLIVLVTRVAVRLATVLFTAVEEGRVTMPWVYPETAQPTRRLVNGLLWVFALALAYPHLPGSGTDAFKGVSVFVGLMISLGSSGIVNQVMSGFTLTYSRALRLNDFVRIGDVEGTVTHLGSLSTKLKTLLREEVTIPNAVVVSTQTTNYSRLADVEGVFVKTTVTIGYDTPWRQVKALLLLAASRTTGVRETPAPAVRQSALEDFYVEYTLLVCLEDPASRLVTLDQLHGHIQDAFNEHGVQIMSPNYEADPAGPKVVPPDRWFASPATK
jgi:small-conductance mechanosensitive channel